MFLPLDQCYLESGVFKKPCGNLLTASKKQGNMFFIKHKIKNFLMLLILRNLDVSNIALLTENSPVAKQSNPNPSVLSQAKRNLSIRPQRQF